MLETVTFSQLTSTVGVLHHPRHAKGTVLWLMRFTPDATRLM